MENILKVSFLAVSLFISSAFADNLILSTKLRIEYPSPIMIGHVSSTLLIKYKDWSFSHENFDPKTFHQQIDLTELERDFIRSIFDDKQRSKLPEWLAVVSRQFSEGMGNDADSVEKIKVGTSEIYTGHNGKKNQGQIFILDDLAIHKITISGTKKQLDIIVKNIKER